MISGLIKADTTPTLDLNSLSQKYMEAYSEWDIDGMSALHASDIKFDDPTATEAFGANYAREGKTKVADFLKGVFGKEIPKHMQFKRNQHFISGQHVIIHSTFESLIPAREKKADSKAHYLVSIPVVTVLRFKGGLITHHTDYVDYNSYKEQITAQQN